MTVEVSEAAEVRRARAMYAQARGAMASRMRWITMFKVHMVESRTILVVILYGEHWADKELSHKLKLHVMSFLLWGG